MGHGYSSITLPAGPSALENAELSDLTFEKSLGRGRFLRTVRARHTGGVVVAKICMKGNTSISFRKYAKRLREEQARLRSIPNVLAYQRIRETNTLGILVRQYIHTSLYDRISIRPFLEDIEKKWIAFQLLSAVRDCHNRDVFHGDIKPENVVVTSWGWVYLTDFASAFKPVYLPDNNPADFYYFYNSSERGICYLAPERFVSASEPTNESNEVEWNMDIFSLGCVLAELFTETATFNLERLFKFRKGEYDPTLLLLDKIDDIHTRSLISSMLRLDPGERWLASDYLDEYKGKAFPLYFYDHLHTLMQEVTDPTLGKKPVATGDANNGESDDRIERIYKDMEMISVSLGYNTEPRPTVDKPKAPSLTDFFPMHVDLPNNRHTAENLAVTTSDNGALILLNVIASSIRSAARATSKIRACELLLAFAERLPDEAKLDRVLPYVLPLLDDPSPMVLVAALRTMTQLLALVKVVAPVNSFLFTQYIFPRLQSFVKSRGFRDHAVVRATYAACLASLAETASRFLDMMQALKASGTSGSTTKNLETDEDGYATYYDAYDSTRLEMQDQFEGQTKVFLTDTDNAVRRAFLTSVTSLCVFFGEARASDVILSHLNTYLNDPDWLLKCAFFRTIVGVAVYIGSANLEEYILPLILQALTDPQELVIEQALRSLASIAEMGLLQRVKTWELIDVVARFQVHPNMWIKEAAAHFISASATYLSIADVRILVAPLIEPYLRVPVITLDEPELLDALKKPLPRTVLDLALQWAAGADQSSFWKTAIESKTLTHFPLQSTAADLGSKTLTRLPKTREDEQWLGRLRNAGMSLEDEAKLLAFREFIRRSAQRAKRDENVASNPLYDQMVSLTKLKITPQTVIFDGDTQTYEQHIEQQERTITEALQEASAQDKAEAPQLRPLDGIQLGEATIQGHSKTGDNTARQNRLSELRKRSSGSLSPSSSSRNSLLGVKDVDRNPRHRSNATGLLSGADLRNKAAPEVATDGATAAGCLDPVISGSGRASPVTSIGDKRPAAAKTASYRAVHNYTGNDPTVLKLLDTVYVDTFPIDATEFGPLVQPRSGPIPNTTGQLSSGPWHPNGQLIATLSEHSAKVTRILPSPDHTFFLTASDDGSVKIWDSARLERNVTHHSRQTFRLGVNVKVTSICFIESTYSFACTGNDGSVRVVKVDVSDSNGTLRYGKLRTVREWTIPTSATNEYAVWTDHFRGDTASTLVLATNLGRILGLDLRYMTLLFDLRNPASHGAPICFCIGRQHDWLLVGTETGILDLWDLRFHQRLRSTAFPAAAPITRLQLHPSRRGARRNRVCICGGTGRGEVTVWDLEKLICHEIYRPHHPNAKDRLHLRDYEVHNLDDTNGGDRRDSLLTRTRLQPISSGSTSDPPSTIANALAASSPALIASSTFHVQTSLKDPDVQHAFVVTGGPDSKVRFWDCERLDGCRLISGGNPGEPSPTYAYSQLSLDTRVLTEKSTATTTLPSSEGNNSGNSAGLGMESNRVTPVSSPRKGTAPVSRSTSGSGSPRSTLSRYDSIRTSARQLLGGHLDIITDVAVVERPVGMVVSADRSGVVFVYT